MARGTRTHLRACVLWILLAGCADVLGLTPPNPVPNMCVMDRDCPPDWSCSNSQCISDTCASPGRSQCNGLELRVCGDDGKWKPDPEKCASRCEIDHCEEAPSCKPLNSCGTLSCCDSIQLGQDHFQLDFEVPAQIGDNRSFPARSVTRSVRPFALDRFEVTVGRFRLFVADYEAARRPLPGAGKHPAFADSGWQERWSESGGPMPQSVEGLVKDLLVRGQPLAGDIDPRLPVRGVNWYVAAAFCIWDGGRLPTEAEWMYAATGGEKRDFPWEGADPLITHDRAVYSGSDLTPDGPAAVGDHMSGQGPFGHEDLAGNVQEWVADVYTATLPPTCHGPSDATIDEFECLERSSNDADRVLRGGAYDDPASLLRNVWRFSRAPQEAKGDAGIRCARDLAAKP